jgi:uncharacterized protein (TIGR03435 family)
MTHPSIFRTPLLAFRSLLLAGAAASASGQAPAPAFEVAVVKPFVLTAGSLSSTGFNIDKGRVRFAGFPLQAVICKAYNLKPYQLAGPAWATGTFSADLFEIEAKLPEGATEDQVPLMLQALLAERFKMTVHRESREQSVYAIVVDKGGIKFKEKPPAQEPPPPPPPLPPGATVMGTPTGQMIMSKGAMTITAAGGDLTMTMGDKGIHFEASKVASLAEFFSPGAGRPVVDKTGLKGSYQIEFDVSDEEMDNPAAAAAFSPTGAGGGAPVASAPVDGSAFFRDILKKNLGLNVESRKDQVEMLVIDHIEKTPSEN